MPRPPFFITSAVVLGLLIACGSSDDPPSPADDTVDGSTQNPPGNPPGRDGSAPVDGSLPPGDGSAPPPPLDSGAPPGDGSTPPPSDSGAPPADSGRDSSVVRDSAVADTSVADTAPPPTCGQPVSATGLVTGGTLTVAGEARGFLVNLPSTYNARTRFPVVFAFHGDGGTGASARSAFNFEAGHESQAIFVYPDGRGGSWDLDSWRVSENRDVQLIDALIAYLQGRYCVNASKLFAAGTSRGAYFANHIGCHRGGTIRGIAAHSGGGPYGLASRGAVFDATGQLVCPGAPTPALDIIGASDGLLGDARQSRDFWKRKNSCSSTSTASPPSPCTASAGCTQPVKYCEIPGLGHALWANGPDTIMSFFAGL